METDEKKEILRRYQKRREERKRIQELIRDMETSPLRSIRFDGVPGSGKKKDLSDLVEKKEKLDAQLRKAFAMECDAMMAIENAVEKLKDPFLRYIIRARYIELKDMDAMAKETEYCETTLWRGHREAIRLLEFDEGKR